ncbi:hypothetical protein [Nocardiopsis prasina]|uniref:hypothetical protein n=1 Tax=Nocardiopsis prasina TaxID=2015 RepID=UPI001268697A|nr:hypothetical protein [Nocardiopsis prasina]
MADHRRASHRLHPADSSDFPVLSPPPSAKNYERYLCGDTSLDPFELPQDGLVGTLSEACDRFG